MKLNKYMFCLIPIVALTCILNGCKDPTYPDIDSPDPNRSGITDITRFEFKFSNADYPDYRDGDVSEFTVYPDQDSIYVYVPWYAPNIMAPEIEVSAGATVSPISGSVRDFSDGAVTYTVRAENGEKRDWRVFVGWEIEPEPMPRDPDPRRPLEEDNPKYQLIKFSTSHNAYNAGGVSRSSSYISNDLNPGTEAGVHTIYFVARHTGELQMALRGRAGNATGSMINVRAFIGEGERDVPIQAEDGSGDYNYTYPFKGTNNNDTLTLHRIILPDVIPDGHVGHRIKLEIRAEGPRNGSYHYRFYEMWVSGWATRGEGGAQYNGKPTGVNFAYGSGRDGRAAPSIHLNMNPPSGNMEYFYTEIMVPNGYDPLHTYFMTSGNSLGYAGIQTNSLTDRRFLFSIWSVADEQNDPASIKEKYNPRLVRVCDQEKYRSRITYTTFGGEGVGGQSRINVMWETNKTYKILLRIRPHPDQERFPGSSLNKAWFHDGTEWMFMCEWRRPEKQPEDNGGNPPAGPYYYRSASHFVEDFNGQMGYAPHMAIYSNHWFITDQGEWVEPVSYTFTGDQAYGRADVAGGVLSEGPYANSTFLKSGGYFTERYDIPNPSFKPSPAVKPDLDLEALNAMGTDDPTKDSAISPGEQYTE